MTAKRRFLILLITILVLCICIVSGDENCKPLVEGHNSLNLSRINIVFVGLMPDRVYENISCEDYLKDIAYRAISYDGTGEGIFSLEPFKSNKDRFNFWYVDKVKPIESMDMYRYQVNYLESLCNFDTKITIAFVGSGEWFRWHADYYKRIYGYIPVSQEEKQSYKENEEKRLEDKLKELKEKTKLWRLLKKMKIISLLEKLKIELVDLDLDIDEYIVKTTVHEFGHAFAGLDDEYTEPGKEEIPPSSNARSKNCFIGDRNSCLNSKLNDKWGDLLGEGKVSCFKGCGGAGKGVFRSSRNSIMNKHFLFPYSFGLVNERILCARILAEAGSVGGYCNQFNLSY